MEIKTTLSCGDKAFGVCGDYGSTISELTVGRVQVTVTDSEGVEGSEFHNYMAQKDYEETVMCVETGVGSGTLWTVGKNIFKSLDEAKEGQEKIFAANAKAIAEQKERTERLKKEEIERYKRLIARLEAE